MMEQVKPQHSLSRVRPVLVRGEEVCWALHLGRLAGTPEKPKDFFIPSSKANSAASLMVNKLMLAVKVTPANVQCDYVPVLKFLGILDFRKSAISLSSSFSLQKKNSKKMTPENTHHNSTGWQTLPLSVNDKSVQYTPNGTLIIRMGKEIWCFICHLFLKHLMLIPTVFFYDSKILTILRKMLIFWWGWEVLFRKVINNLTDVSKVQH